MFRRSENKRSSSRSFNKHAKRTHPMNVRVMRGGFRL